ncbi:MAG: hypothetical protein EOS34_20920 [Mesorhizobium sp.]|nr:MAG: hypothetical protein EOS34_20920 [Mesorhizobium sp.]
MIENGASDGARTRDLRRDRPVNLATKSAKVSSSQGREWAGKCPKVETNSADIPIGGTTGLCHQSNAAIEIAAAWYGANLATCQHPIIPALRRRFGLTALQAISVLREVRRQ